MDFVSTNCRISGSGENSYRPVSHPFGEEGMGRVIRGNFHSKTSKKILQQFSDVFQFKVVLLGTEPLLWRRFHIPSSCSLEILHHVIRISMGWSDTVLHQFIIGREIYGMRSGKNDTEKMRIIDERKERLVALKVKILNKFIYEYHGNVQWRFEITLEKVVTGKETILKHPLLLAGEQICPTQNLRFMNEYGIFFIDSVNSKEAGNEASLPWIGNNNPNVRLAVEEINNLLGKVS